MKFLQFGMKYYCSKNIIKRAAGLIALQIAKMEADRIEKEVEDFEMDMPAEKYELEEIFKRIRQLEKSQSKGC